MSVPENRCNINSSGKQDSIINGHVYKMSNFMKAVSFFFGGAFSVLLADTAKCNIEVTLEPLIGGHSFEQGGWEGFMLGTTASLIISLLHTFIFTVPLGLSLRFGCGVLISKPLFASFCGIITAIIYITTTTNVPTAILIPSFSFCSLIVILEVYAKQRGTFL